MNICFFLGDGFFFVFLFFFLFLAVVLDTSERMKMICSGTKVFLLWVLCWLKSMLCVLRCPALNLSSPAPGQVMASVSLQVIH